MNYTELAPDDSEEMGKRRQDKTRVVTVMGSELGEKKS